MKLSQKQIDGRMAILTYWLNFGKGDEPYNRHIVDRIYNGFHHICIEETNDLLIAGTMRECYDAMYYMTQGIKFGKGIM